MFRFVPRIAAVLLLFVAGALPSAAARERPIKAGGEGDVNFAGFLEGTGKATHFGRTALLVFLNTDYVGNGGLFISTSLGQITSANGDILQFNFGDGDYAIDSAGVVSVPLTFIGGTGRFQDATGSADMVFDFDPEYLSFRFVIVGSIDY